MFKYDDSLRQMTFQQPEPQEQQAPEYKPPSAKICPWCSKPIWFGDRAVTIDHGYSWARKEEWAACCRRRPTDLWRGDFHELCLIAWPQRMWFDSSDEVEGVIDTITADNLWNLVPELAPGVQLSQSGEEKIDGD